MCPWLQSEAKNWHSLYLYNDSFLFAAIDRSDLLGAAHISHQHCLKCDWTGKLWMFDLNSASNIFLPGEKEQFPSSLALRTATVERVLLHHGHQQSALRQDGGEPYLCSHPVGQKPWGARQMGWSQDRFPLDRCHYDSAKARGLDTSPGSPRCGMLPHERWLVDQLGGRNEGKLSLDLSFDWELQVKVPSLIQYQKVKILLQKPYHLVPKRIQ